MKIPTLSFAALATAVQPRGAGPGSTAGASPSKQEEMAARKLQQAKDAVATLKTIKTKTSDSQKAQAAQKVKELKARLQALKLLYANDPKKLARAAAQIARELAGAVKSYVSAGGSTMDLGGADAGDAAAGAAAPAGAEEGTAPAGPESAEAGQPAESTPTQGDAAEATPAKPGDPAPATSKAQEEKSANDRARAKADADFKDDVRDLARALKAALRRQGARHRDDDDQRSGEQALATVDQAMGALPIADAGAVSALAGI
ncbi:hypothetical protein [Sphingomonas sp. TDK1]|uniref:hypothetical protein n=1 Tax=Sphingomonas sp. TDK1 TaxID=453247 RepID=UPI0012EE6C2B|nr:hypothetical protein [Sphingomonas sp. TDK1]